MHRITVPHGKHEHICSCAYLHIGPMYGVVARILSRSETAYLSHHISKGPSEKNLRTRTPCKRDKARLSSTYPFWYLLSCVAQGLRHVDIHHEKSVPSH